MKPVWTKDSVDNCHSNPLIKHGRSKYICQCDSCRPCSCEKCSQKPVVCQACMSRYTSILPADICRKKQGIDCASSMSQDPTGQYVIVCSYGSEFDTDLWAVDTRKFPETISTDLDPVCDKCLKVWMGTGILRYVGCYLDFEED